MGYRSDVKLIITKEGYDMIAAVCEKSDKEYVKEMLTYGTVTETSEDNDRIPEGFISVLWTYVKWNECFEDVQAVTNVLKELNERVEKDPETLDKYCFKLLEIGEDNRTDEWTNDWDEEFLGDFYVECKFSI